MVEKKNNNSNNKKYCNRQEVSAVRKSICIGIRYTYILYTYIFYSARPTAVKF